MPTLIYNLISIDLLANINKVAIFTKEQCLILDNEYNKKIIVLGSRNQQIGLYQFLQKIIEPKPNLIIIEKKM